MNAKIQSAAFDRAVEPVLQMLTADQTEWLATYSCDERLQERLEELAQKSTEGELSDDERDEYEGYVRAEQFLSVLKVKARRLCESRAAS